MRLFILAIVLIALPSCSTSRDLTTTTHCAKSQNDTIHVYRIDTCYDVLDSLDIYCLTEEEVSRVYGALKELEVRREMQFEYDSLSKYSNILLKRNRNHIDTIERLEFENSREKAKKHTWLYIAIGEALVLATIILTN